MLWCPDEAKTKAKMLYSSSVDALKKALTGVALYVEVGDGMRWLLKLMKLRMHAGHALYSLQYQTF